MSKPNIYAYSGYKYEIPDKLTINFNSSYETTRDWNYSNTFNLTVGASSVSLTHDEVFALHRELQEILDLSEMIPNKDNVDAFR